MRVSIFFAITIIAMTGCAPSTPDDRVIEVISDTGPGGATADAATAAPIATDTIEEAPLETASSDDAPALADIELCDASQYRPLVGQAAGGRQFPTGPSLRVFGVNDIVTQDYVPQRTNIVADDSGKIVRVYCG